MRDALADFDAVATDVTPPWELFVLRGRAFAALNDVKSAISNITQATILFEAAGASQLEENTPIALA
jgi:hypothetical protein